MEVVVRYETKISYPVQLECESYSCRSIYIQVTAHPIIIVQYIHLLTRIISNGNWSFKNMQKFPHLFICPLILIL